MSKLYYKKLSMKPMGFIRRLRYRRLTYLSENIRTEIYLDILNSLYKNTIPKLNFYKALKKGKFKEDDYFMNFYIDIVTYNNIIEKKIKFYKNLNPKEIKSIINNVHLGISPTNNEELWLKQVIDM